MSIPTVPEAPRGEAVATLTATFDFLRTREFRLDRLLSTLGSGCNEFVFTRESGGRQVVHQVASGSRALL